MNIVQKNVSQIDPILTEMTVQCKSRGIDISDITANLDNTNYRIIPYLCAVRKCYPQVDMNTIVRLFSNGNYLYNEKPFTPDWGIVDVISNKHPNWLLNPEYISVFTVPVDIYEVIIKNQLPDEILAVSPEILNKIINSGAVTMPAYYYFQFADTIVKRDPFSTVLELDAIKNWIIKSNMDTGFLGFLLELRVNKLDLIGQFDLLHSFYLQFLSVGSKMSDLNFDNMVFSNSEILVDLWKLSTVIGKAVITRVIRRDFWRLGLADMRSLYLSLLETDNFRQIVKDLDKVNVREDVFVVENLEKSLPLNINMFAYLLRFIPYKQTYQLAYRMVFNALEISEKMGDYRWQTFVSHGDIVKSTDMVFRGMLHGVRVAMYLSYMREEHIELLITANKYGLDQNLLLTDYDKTLEAIARKLGVKVKDIKQRGLETLLIEKGYSEAPKLLELSA